MPIDIPNVPDRIENDFRSHSANPAQRDAMDTVRDACRTAARVVVDNVPPGREQASALTKLEEAMFHANAGIARSRS